MLNPSPRFYAAPTRASRLRYIIEPDDGAGAGGGQEQQPEAPKFPANTPVKDMTPEQQVAFHENKARRLEDTLKGFNGLTPKQITDLQSEVATLRTKGQSAEDAALEQAKESGRAEVRTVLAAERVRANLERALTGRVPSATALLDLDRSTFIKGDSADVEAINAWVEANSAAVTQQKNAPDLGQGRNRGTGTPTKGVGAGADMFANSRKKTTS
jgi:hypothetical protein